VILSGLHSPFLHFFASERENGVILRRNSRRLGCFFGTLQLSLSPFSIQHRRGNGESLVMEIRPEESCQALWFRNSPFLHFAV
jgi:hypothetical protein